MTTWIVRIVLTVLVIEAGVCVAILADDWSALRNREEGLFRAVLSATRDEQDFVLDETEPVSRVRLVRPLVSGEPQPYLHVSVSEKSQEILESVPPSPMDWHLILKHMHEVGCEVAAVEQPLTWEGYDRFHLKRLSLLNRSLGLFETAILTVDLQRMPPGQNRPLPEYLKRSAIPIGNVRGELGRLVRVDGLVLPPSASAASNVRFSFRIQESMEGARPHFVRWDDHLIPSFPLAIAMAQHGVAPDEVKVDLGRHIRLGEGPIIPIDEIGQLTGKETRAAQPVRAGIGSIRSPDEILVASLPADDAVLQSQIPAARKLVGDPVPRCALFTDASSTNPAPWKSHKELQKIVSSFDILPRPSEVATHRRLSSFTELTLLFLVAVLAVVLMNLRGFLQHLSFIVLTIVVATCLLALFATSQKWTPLTPVLATALAGWFLSVRLARYLPPKQAKTAPAAAPN